jgi:integrase
MAKLTADLLTDLAIRAAKPTDGEFTLRDGNGLFLLVHPNGSKYFQLRTTLHGKPKKIQLGTYPDMLLAQARDKARELRNQVKHEHLDPILEKKLEKERKAKEAVQTFKMVALDWLAIKKRTLAPTTHLKIEQTFNANVYSYIGDYPVTKIDNLQVRKLLQVMQKRGALEIMEKTRGWIRAVFNFALSDKLITENPVPAIDERLHKHVGRSYPHLQNLADAGKLLRNLNEYDGSFEVAACIRLQIHLAQRPSELRMAQWSEFDLEAAVWTLPIDRSKTRKHMTKTHTIMLSTQAIAILKDLHQYTGHQAHLFLNSWLSKPVSDQAINKALHKSFTDYHIVPHGFRHFFSTQANEACENNKQIGFSSAVIEKFIQHAKGGTKGIYDGSEYIEPRRILAQWWSDQLDVARDGAKVLPFKQA